MNKVKIKIVIDLENPDHVNAVNSIKADIFQGEKPTYATNPNAKKEEVEPAKPKAVKKVVKKAAPKVEEKETPTRDFVGNAEENSYTITRDSLREIMAAKVEMHKAAMVKKLGEFGVKKLATLDEEYFGEFNDFLVSLD